MMVDNMKRPGSPARESHRSRRRHSRSPTPVPPHSSSLPPLDQRKVVTTSDTSPIAVLKEERSVVNHRNASSVEVTSTLKSTNALRDAKAMDPVKNTVVDKEPVLSETAKNDSGAILTRDSGGSPVTEKLKEKVALSNRKRSPSPTLFVPPHSKHNNRDLARADSTTKLMLNDKSPSPTPLLAPMRQTGLSSASQVLNEEFKRKQTTQNLKLKQSICKEIRKNNKSNYNLLHVHSV